MNQRSGVSAYDYVIVGAGAAGCTLAYRLSEDPSVDVLLLEAGPRDTNPLIHMPKGVAKVMSNRSHIWFYPSTPEISNAHKPEYWLRGRVLGGSSSTNGMMYVRGQPADFDSIAETTSDDWSWRHIGAAYKALESHQLGAGETRGGRGPLKVALPDQRDMLTEAMIRAGQSLGWKVKDDVNAPDDSEGLGYAPRTIHKGRRQSAAVAFLNPIRNRANLTILTDAAADKVLFDDAKHAVGVEISRSDEREIMRGNEIILCGGAMSSPGILERSGIGDPARLGKLGIPLVHANPNVGENLIEHRCLTLQWKLNRDISHNKKYYGAGLLFSALQYYLTRSGPMSAGAYEQIGWFKTRPDLARPDAQFLFAPFSLDYAKMRRDVEHHQGMHINAYQLRPTSRGHIHITSPDPNAPPELFTNYHSTQLDRDTMIRVVRKAREFVRQQPLAQYVEAETVPGPDYDTDEKIIEAYDKFGICGFHAVGSCRMDRDPERSVVDPELRVRGVCNLRIIDTSIMPVLPSGNTMGPTMAMAWRAAEVIRRDNSRRGF